jgi:hypothetical protein
MKIILLILLLFFACAIAMTLLTRLLRTTQQLASLRWRPDAQQRSDAGAVARLQQAQAAQESQQPTQEDATSGSQVLDPRVLEARERSKEEPKEL